MFDHCSRSAHLAEHLNVAQDANNDRDQSIYLRGYVCSKVRISESLP